ncbi:hypothetical protein E2C01_033362 [Portunus trituberculatus]|uniref:Uncharacterized protein n=1 Tax=Portunus trituberculatus TaxID=210409 RepID=A0A5B7F404_PORTR|nr:hypothetical protein [Portunus trituberculatus]
MWATTDGCRKKRRELDLLDEDKQNCCQTTHVEAEKIRKEWLVDGTPSALSLPSLDAKDTTERLGNDGKGGRGALVFGGRGRKLTQQPGVKDLSLCDERITEMILSGMKAHILTLFLNLNLLNLGITQPVVVLHMIERLFTKDI